ncbi:MAG: LysM peptidoglycan-binding domain-containing protein [Chloroflexi bacterium]|nr:SdrD B-like domain-containing protein [Anaerolineaceae bacterium]NMB90691.1 LysM peptidoglycan-binding domain-containing protein [Chloroflexota bacterium]
MKRKIYLLFGIVGILGLLSMTVPVVASSQQPQVFYQTPTPGPDGRILYIVQAGDSCLSISLLTGVDVNTLRTTNNLDQECSLREGQELLLGINAAPTNTPGPAPTATIPLPSPTPFNGNGQICIYLFNDVNGNAMADENELPLAGGAVSVSDRLGKVSLTGNTLDTGDPVCFDEVPEGEYNISVAVPEGYNATTNTNYPLQLNAGDQSTLDFGAQVSSEVDVTATTPEGNQSPLLGILGGLLVVAGAGLGFYFRTMKR